MFNCDRCGKTTKSVEKANFVVDKRRNKAYNNNGKITYGWEIVKELKVCKECYNES